MEVNERELENLILSLLDRSSAIQNKIRSLCTSPQSGKISQTSAEASEKGSVLSSWFDRSDKKKIEALESHIEQLKKQLSQLQYENQLADSKMREYHSYADRLKSN